MGSPYQNAPPNEALSREQKLALYRTMVRSRRFGEAAQQPYSHGKMGGWLQLSDGQEGISVAISSLLGQDDHCLTSFRHFAVSIAVGMSMDECMAELYGKETGCSKGKGGALSMFAPDKNYWGSNPIAGSHVPLATGVAFALKYRGIEGCCVCFLGDGEMNQGAVHEAMNLAALYSLPIVFVIESNDLALWTKKAKSTAMGSCLGQRAEAYGINWERFDGNDLYEVRAKASPHLESARSQSTPAVLELDYFRLRNFHMADASWRKLYSPEEIEYAREHYDPVKIWRRQLRDTEGILPEGDIKSINTLAKLEARAACEFAENSPFPTHEDITRHVYWEIDNRPEESHGRHFFDS